MGPLLRPALSLLVISSLVTGLVYPAFLTLVSGTLFPRQAHGSLIEKDGVILGSRLIGQPFAGENYFWSRPSATAPNPYNALASSGSNLGPLNPALVDAVKARVATFGVAATTPNPVPIPADLVTTSASGLDPDISVAGAMFQAARVANARHLGQPEVAALIAAHTAAPEWGLFGEARVNVLELNLALDRLAPAR